MFWGYSSIVTACRPHVLLSVATSIDGFIDDYSNDRLMLSNPADFDRVDQLRAEADAILVGAGTIRADNPRLVIRSDQRRRQRVVQGRPEHPTKVTVTGSGALDANHHWFHTGEDRLIYTPADKADNLTSQVGHTATVIGLKPNSERDDNSKNPHSAESSDNGPSGVNLIDVLDDLSARGIKRLLVEGGESLNTALVAAGVVDELRIAVAPLLVGRGPRFLAETTFDWPTNQRIQLVDAEPLGDMAVLRYRTQPAVPASDADWLQKAVDLAQSCPPADHAFSVGAIIVDQDGAEIARGYSRETNNTIHAEESALAKVGGDPRLVGATIYSTLEPCGDRRSSPKTCADLIIEAGISKVVMAWREPTTFVESPRGLTQLKAAGIDVVELPDIAEPNFAGD